MVHTLYSALGRQRQVYLCETDDSLVYRVRPCLEKRRKKMLIALPEDPESSPYTHVENHNHLQLQPGDHMPSPGPQALHCIHLMHTHTHISLKISKTKQFVCVAQAVLEQAL